MSTIQKIAFIMVVVVLAAGAAFCWLNWNVTLQDLNLTKVELLNTQAALERGREELSATRVELSTTQAILEGNKEKLSVAQEELSTMRSEWQATKSSLANMGDELQGTRNRLSTVETELEATKARLSAIQTDALNLHDPTLVEAIRFLVKDKTSANKYIEEEYVCTHFARDVNNNAESQGIRCAFIDIRFPESAHAVIAFDTIDEGMVYFDPQHDERVVPVIGKEYWRCIQPRPDYYYKKPAYDDTIRDIIVIW